MKKIIFILLTGLIMTSCSSLEKRETTVLNEQEKQSLTVLLEEIKEEFYQNRTEKLRETLIPSLRNTLVKNELDKIDLSRVKVFSSKPEFTGMEAANTIALNYGSETAYFQVQYILEGEKWKITEFKERR